MSVTGPRLTHNNGYDVQLVGGQYVTGGIVGKRKRIPATSLKAALISEILDPELDPTPFLKINIRLEVSACTGNTGRLSLWCTLCLSQSDRDLITLQTVSMILLRLSVLKNARITTA